MTALRDATKLALFELPTLPPSLLGMRQRIQLRHKFESLGGLMINGDSALSATFEGNQVLCINTRLLEDEEITADNFVLASGSFFSKGLISNLIKFMSQFLNPILSVLKGLTIKIVSLGLLIALLIHNLINQQA